MAKSNLLKEAIADAKAVRETAIANAKIALEEAFTPRLQSILSQKLQTELEKEEGEEDLDEEYGSEDTTTAGSSEVGAGASADSGTNNKQPSAKANTAHTELGDTDKETSAVGSELDDTNVVKEEEDENGDGVIDDPTGASVTEEEHEDYDEEEGDVPGEQDTGPDEYEDEDDELDLESIIKELESEFGDDEEEGEEASAEEIESDEEGEIDVDTADEDDFAGEAEDEDEIDVDDVVDTDVGDEEEDEDDIDLDEILREMGYGDDEEGEEETETEPEVATELAEKDEQLKEAYSVIKQLKGTINEVNLLNAKLLYSNKLFRNYEMTNEQKMKVVETLDRTMSVREVKLVFATLAESLKYNGSTKKKKTKITESFSSNPTKSTAPKKEILEESNDMAERFKKLANIKG